MELYLHLLSFFVKNIYILEASTWLLLSWKMAKNVLWLRKVYLESTVKTHKSKLSTKIYEHNTNSTIKILKLLNWQKQSVFELEDIKPHI